MVLFWIAIGLDCSLILITEWIVWKCFRRKIAGIHFPRRSDSSHFRFFTIGRIRTCACLHCIFLLAVSAGLLFFLW